jgi:aldose 1-epimerase
MSTTAPLTLSAGPLRLIVTPGLGGSVSAFTYMAKGREWPVFRGSTPDESSVLNMGNFPLVPYVNRIRDGRFSFRGREVRLTPDVSFDPSPLHGDGWVSAWKVESATQSQVELSFWHTPGEWPWAYSATQRFVLDDSGLSLLMTCTNESDEPMPCGLGQHPYFHCTSETVLDTRVDHVWTIDELVLPVEKVPAEENFSLSNRKVCGQTLDHGFGGWNGRAVISDPAWPFKVELSSPDARFFQVYSPPTGNFFVAEPVTHANAALNAPEEQWPELGMRVIEPGETMKLETRFDLIAV